LVADPGNGAVRKLVYDGISGTYTVSTIIGPFHGGRVRSNSDPAITATPGLSASSSAQPAHVVRSVTSPTHATTSETVGTTFSAPVAAATFFPSELTYNPRGTVIYIDGKDQRLGKVRRSYPILTDTEFKDIQAECQARLDTKVQWTAHITVHKAKINEGLGLDVGGKAGQYICITTFTFFFFLSLTLLLLLYLVE
jgi:hypothetical protein